MKTRDAIRFFGSQENLRAALNLKCRQTIWAWDDFPPYSRQYQIEVLTNGVLRAERPGSEKAAERPPLQQATEGTAIRANQPFQTIAERRRAFADPANHDAYTGIERCYILLHPACFERPGA